MDASPSRDDMLKICGHAVAFVLAPNESAGKNIADAVQAAHRSEVAAIFILADVSCSDDAVEAVRTIQRKGRTMIQATELDFSAVYGDPTDGAAFHLEELPLNMIEVMRALAASVLDVYESILVIDGTQAVPTPEQLYDLCYRLRMGEASGEVFVRQDASPSPYAVSRAYLEEVETPLS